MNELQKYVGRAVRLNAQSFREIAARVPKRAAELENCFIVAEVRQRARKLICYGGALRITIGASEVVLV